MKIVRDWTTLELIEFLNSYRNATEVDRLKYNELMTAVHKELNFRQPLMGVLYNS